MAEDNKVKGVINHRFLDRKKSNRVLIISLVVLAFFVIALFTNGFGLFNSGGSNVILEIGDAPVLGNANAPVAIFEFSDFSCPYCAAANGYNAVAVNALRTQDPNWQPPMPNIINDYVKTGKAKVVFRYAKGHGTGQNAQIIGWCLNEQNLFWEFHDLAFKNQKDIIDFDKMKALALSLGANETLLNSCLDSNKYNSRLASDEAIANSVGISGTPTFFVNGVRVEGAVSYSEFKKVIDKELAGN